MTTKHWKRSSSFSNEFWALWDLLFDCQTVRRRENLEKRHDTISILSHVFAIEQETSGACRASVSRLSAFRVQATLSCHHPPTHEISQCLDWFIFLFNFNRRRRRCSRRQISAGGDQSVFGGPRRWRLDDQLPIGWAEFRAGWKENHRKRIVNGQWSICPLAHGNGAWILFRFRGFIGRDSGRRSSGFPRLPRRCRRQLDRKTFPSFNRQ